MAQNTAPKLPRIDARTPLRFVADEFDERWTVELPTKFRYDTYETAEALRKEVDEWGHENGFLVASSRTQRDRADGILKKVQLMCGLARRRQGRGTIRKTTTTKCAPQCPFELTIQRKKREKSGRWFLTARSLEHIGHGHTAETQLLRRPRELTQEEVISKTKQECVEQFAASLCWRLTICST